jgi:hypothetical protein
MPRDHFLLIRGDDPDAYPAISGADAGIDTSIGFAVERNAEPFRSRANLPADFRRVFANACREDEPIKTPKRGGERPNLTGDA